jgi:hypothetical protein
MSFLHQWVGKNCKAYSVRCTDSNWSPSKTNGIDLYLFWKDLISISPKRTGVYLHWIILISTSIYWNRFQSPRSGSDLYTQWIEMISTLIQSSCDLLPSNGNDIYPHSTELIAIPNKWSWYLPIFKGHKPFSHWIAPISVILNRADLHIKWTWPQFPFNVLNTIGLINFIFSRTTEGKRTSDNCVTFNKQLEGRKIQMLSV